MVSFSPSSAFAPVWSGASIDQCRGCPGSTTSHIRNPARRAPLVLARPDQSVLRMLGGLPESASLLSRAVDAQAGPRPAGGTNLARARARPVRRTNRSEPEGHEPGDVVQRCWTAEPAQTS